MKNKIANLRDTLPLTRQNRFLNDPFSRNQISGKGDSLNCLLIFCRLGSEIRYSCLFVKNIYIDYDIHALKTYD